MPNDQMGRFNMDEAASELSMDPEYVRALFKPLKYTFFVKSQRYPSEHARSTRPGELASAMDKMFPLHKKNRRLNKELREVDRSQFSTF
jgi:hypothetical protein